MFLTTKIKNFLYCFIIGKERKGNIYIFSTWNGRRAGKYFEFDFLLENASVRFQTIGSGWIVVGRQFFILTCSNEELFKVENWHLLKIEVVSEKQKLF